MTTFLNRSPGPLGVGGPIPDWQIVEATDRIPDLIEKFNTSLAWINSLENRIIELEAEVRKLKRRGR